MSDYRVSGLNDNGYVRDYDSYILVDRSSLVSSRNFNVSSLFNNEHFEYLKDSYKDDMVYYYDRLEKIKDDFIEISDSGHNVDIVDEYVGDRKKYSLNTSSYSYSSNKIISNQKYLGRLYRWDDAMNIADSVDGWHLPTISDFEELENFCGTCEPLKSTFGWMYDYLAGTDEYGFCALPCGWYSEDNREYYDVGTHSNFLVSNRNGRYCCNVDINGGIYLRIHEDTPFTHYEAVRLIKDEFDSSVTSLDISGHSYKTVTIGNQTWMVENLDIITESGSVVNLNSLYSEDEAFKFYDNSDGYNVEKIAVPNFYSKEVIDKKIDDAKFEVISKSDVLVINSADNGFVISNSGLYTNNASDFNLTNNVSNYNYSTFSIGDNSLYKNCDLIISKIGNDITEGNSNTLTIKDSNVSLLGNDNLLLIRGSNENLTLSIDGNNILIVSGYTQNVGNISNSLIISKNVGSGVYLDDIDCKFIIGDWDNKTVDIDSGKFEFGTYNDDEFNGFGLYDDGEVVSFSVGSKTYRSYSPLQFGEVSEDISTPRKFIITCKDNAGNSIDLLQFKNGSLFYKNHDLGAQRDDIYVTSGYWDLVIHKNELKRNVLYTY